MAKKITFEIDVDDSGAVKAINKLDQGIEDVADSTKKAEKGVSKFGKSFASIAKSAGIVSLLLGAFELLKESLGKNQKVIDVLSNVTTTLGIVFNDLFNLVANNITPAIEYMVNLFSDIPALFEKVKQAIYNNLEVRFNALIKTFGLLGDAITKVFDGDFSGAMESAGEAATTYVDVLTGVEGTVDKVTDGVTSLVDATIEYTTATYQQAEAITANAKSLELLEAQQTRIREQSDRDAERQRQIRDDETRGIDERIAANQRLAEILTEQEEREKQTVNDRIAALQAEQAQLGITQERTLEIYQLQTELAAIEAQQEGFRSEQLINENALIREKTELLGFQTQAQLDAYNAEQEALLKLEKEKKDAEKRADDEAKKQDKIRKEKQNADINSARAVASSIESIAGEGTDAAKAAGVAGVAIDVAKGVTGALAGWSSLGPLGIAGAVASSAAIVASGVSSVKNILAVKSGAGNATSNASKVSGSAPPAATITPPSFSTAADGGTNQLAADIADSQNTQPVKAYVVSNDVTNGQQLDRNTEKNATF